MKIKKQKITLEGFEGECEICGFCYASQYEAQVRSNLEQHMGKHKKKKN